MDSERGGTDGTPAQGQDKNCECHGAPRAAPSSWELCTEHLGRPKRPCWVTERGTGTNPGLCWGSVSREGLELHSLGADVTGTLHLSLAVSQARLSGAWSTLAQCKVSLPWWHWRGFGVLPTARAMVP